MGLAISHMLDDVRSITPAGAMKWARNFDYNNLQDMANLSGIFMFTVLMGLVAVVIYAQVTPGTEPAEYLTNAALGIGSEAKHKPGSPPIPPPTEIVSMRVYPIKSCRGIEVDETRLRKTGLLLDRNWMFISKSDRKFMTIRSNPKMTLVDTNIIEKDNATFNGDVVYLVFQIMYASVVMTIRESHVSRLSPKALRTTQYCTNACPSSPTPQASSQS